MCFCHHHHTSTPPGFLSGRGWDTIWWSKKEALLLFMITYLNIWILFNILCNFTLNSICCFSFPFVNFRKLGIGNNYWRTNDKEGTGNIKKRGERKIYSKPDLEEESLRKEKERWKKRVKDGKIKSISDLNERDKRHKRRMWRNRQKDLRERRRMVPESRETPSDGP